jgi:adenine-specific DNA-methyltransferase
MEKQESLNLNVDAKIDSIEEYQFEPIKGYPMLHWKGKRPFTSTQFYPAQLKENHGEEVNGWMNKIFWGDNVQVMSHLLKEYRGKINLIYIDPPFDSKADYKKKISLRGKEIKNSTGSFEEKQYSDIWTNDEYFQFIYERLILIRELLSSKGSFYLHVDHNKVHYLKCICDEIFGSGSFKNEIIWKCSSAHANTKTKYDITHQTILFYTKSDEYKWNHQYQEYNEDYVKTYYRFKDKDGKLFKSTDLTGRLNKTFEWKGISRPWAYSKVSLDNLEKEGKIYWTKNGIPRLKQYLDEMPGIALSTIWTDINPVKSWFEETLHYPTQKPNELLSRIILASTNPGDIVFDCFMGSGTTQAVASKLGRKFLGADINLGAIQITTKRLLKIAKEIEENNKLELKTDGEEINHYTGFSVYNVNNYDIFRNPAQAKEIIIQALEIQPLVHNTIYDGEKDGRLVKIMPINWIATRADLNELITGFNYKEFEKRNATNPGKPVAQLMLICMGHEPDLAASLQKEVPYKLDIEVVDILRDKSNLEFKRDSEAEIIREDGLLVIEQFYPMNLLQKLSIMKENIEDWKELTESVMIDFNYDGSVFEPQTVDVPEKNELVKGKYKIPEDHGTIKIKITDLLSESLEMEL